MFLGNLSEFRYLMYLEVDQRFVFPSKIQGIRKGHKNQKALLKHFPKSLRTLKHHSCTSLVALMILKVAAEGRCWPKMGTLQLTYLPRKRKLHQIRKRLRKNVKTCEEKGISVHVEEI